MKIAAKRMLQDLLYVCGSMERHPERWDREDNISDTSSREESVRLVSDLYSLAMVIEGER